MGRKRTYRTRQAPFAEVWRQVEILLQNEPGLQAKTAVDWLQERDSGKFDACQRGTAGPTLARDLRSGSGSDV